jgi:hypothetical protein
MRSSLLALSLVACAAPSPRAIIQPVPAFEPDHAELDPQQVAAVRLAAAAYTKWGRVDARPNIAPELCRAPLPEDYGAPSHVRMSAADDAPHGKKLYYLWASDKRAYLGDTALPVGFAIVKESFAAVPSKPIKSPEQPRISMSYDLPPIDWMIDDDGHYLRAGARKDLYVMVKVGDQPGADHGWIYGTVAPDGRVTSAGKVATCMGCHDDGARRERLFGLRLAPRS